ncbi:MAG: hypothetical protein JWR16_2738 [Nevskia sp.]|nr:hypothetical protein [Nevskia sp.]
MNLLAIVLALIAERLSSPHRHAEVARTQVWQTLRNTLPGLWTSAAAIVALILLPVVLVEALHRAITPMPLRLLFDAALLFVCLGPRDLSDDIKLLRAARAQADSAAVTRISAQLQMGPEPDTDHRSLIGALFIQSHERLFGMLWWFLLGGPAGAVLYRIASRLPCLIADTASPAARLARQIHAVLAWLPARLTAALFALAGSMDDAARAWRRLRLDPHADWQRRTWTVLAEVAAAALDWEDSSGGGAAENLSLDAVLHEVQRMQARTLLILLAVAALLSAGTFIA